MHRFMNLINYLIRFRIINLIKKPLLIDYLSSVIKIAAIFSDKDIILELLSVCHNLNSLLKRPDIRGPII